MRAITIAVLLLSLLLAPISSYAAAKALAVVGLCTYAPEAADCPWLGCGIGDGISGRLSGEGTGITPVDRAYIAEVLLAAGMKPLEETGTDPERLKATAEALRRQHTSAGDRSAQAKVAVSREIATGADGRGEMVSAQAATFSALSGLGGRIPATHLLVGSVTAEKGLGEDCTITLRAEVVDVATSAIVLNSGIEKSVSATAEGLQKLEAQVAMAACLALDGDATAVDQKVDVERSDFYAQLAEANRLIYDGKPEQALRITQVLASSVKAEMLTKVAETESAAYQALIEQAVQEGRRADSAALAEEAKRREQELRNQYEQAKRKSADDAEAGAAELRVQSGDAYYYNGKFEEAIAEYTKALPSSPDNAGIWFARGTAYNYLKQYEEAIADYTKAIELDPEDPAAYNNRGIANYYQEQYDCAIADYDKAIELQPRLALAYLGRGVAYKDQKQYDRAVADYDKAIEFNPDDAMAHWFRGNAYYDQKQYDRAIADYEKAIELKPDFAYAYNSRGVAYSDLKQYDRAIADWDKAIELRPDYADAYYNRGTAYSDLEQYDRAIADYTKAIEIRPDCADVYHNRGNAHFLKGEYDRAIADFTKAIELDPGDAGAYFLRGVAHFIKGECDRAIADHQRAIELAPEDAAPRASLCFWLYFAGRLDEAVVVGREAVRVAPDVAFVVGRLAVALLASGQDDEAVAQYRHLVEIGAQAAVDAGAGKDLDDLLAKRPDLHLAHFCLGLLYEGAGKRAEAAEQFEAYLAGAPEGKWAKEARERLAGVE